MNKSNINQLRKAIGKEALLDLMEVKSGGAAHASEQGADTKRLETFVRNWPQVHKAIRSDIMLGEAAEEITALAELYAALSQTK